MISGTRGCSSRGGFAAPLHGGAMRRVLAYVLAASIPAAPVLAQPPDAKAVSITMEDVTYPHPVKFLEFSIYDEDVRLAYMDVAAEGTPNGRTVVLFHGMNFFGEYWAGPIDVLRRAGFRVVVPDQIGFGRSSKPVIPYNFHDMARNTKRLLDALGIARTAIVGHSMGGMLAARFATQYPDVVERVVIYNPIGLTDSRFGRPWTDEEDQYRRVLGQSYASASAGIRRYFAHDADAWKPEYEKYVLIHYGWTLSGDWPRFARVRARIQQAVYLDPVVHDWQHIRVPTLAIGGAEDGANFGERMRFLAESIPNGNGRLHLIPGVGHVPHFEAPEKLYPPLLTFLREGR
jgi:pimeloyl-ACP methyl ester carboxylesterase